MNQFLKAMNKTARTWNDAVSYVSSGSTLLDYFGKAGSYRGRTLEEVFSDMSSIFAEDPLNSLKAVFYNRMVTRKPKGFNNECDSLHKGQGQRDETQKAFMWLEQNNPDLLYKNLWLVPIVGRWSDLWYDSAATGFYHYINTEKVYPLVKAGLASEYHRGLLAKMLPKIRSRKNTKNERHARLNKWAKGLCQYLGWAEADYRRFKSNPEHGAHVWQRQMCWNAWNQIDFNLISGKALFNLLSHKGKDGKNAITRHDLEAKYLDWIKSQPVAKFTGYPYELYKAAKNKGRTLVQRYTYNKQFEGLLEKARSSVPKELLEKGVLCALDTSGSMESGYWGNGIDPKVAPIDICVGLGIYFASLIEGYFHNHVIMFDNTSRFLKLNGEFCDKADQIPANAMGGTNFQSVIDEIVRVRKQNPNIPVSDFPQVLLVVSDMQFNPANNTYTYYSRGESYSNAETNYEAAMRKLREVGLPEMTIIWWQVNGRFTGDVPSTMNDPGTVLVSGFDGAIVTTILGGMEKVVDKDTGELRSKTPYEVMMDCLNQEILNKVQV